jgi:hypothetical protein
VAVKGVAERADARNAAVSDNRTTTKEQIVQLESHATPSMETPQQRYANLHRAIERGLDSDEVWKELADISLRLGHGDEAVRCMRRIGNEATRLALASRLARLGLVEDVAGAPSSSEQHSAAPAASDAGPAASSVASGPPRLVDHVVDALQYLMHQHMPALVLFTTLAFPLVVGVGGFLTAGGSWVLLAAIAAIPGLSVLAVVGAMGRQVLIASAEGNGDVPPIPRLADLAQDAKRFLLDAALVTGSLLGPSLLAMACGTPWTAVVPGLLIGAFFAPMAWALRHLRGDLGALSPVTLMRAVARTAGSYPALAIVNVLLFAPIALVAFLVFGRPIWVQIAVIGPLCVLPVFVASRLLGTWLEFHRERLGGLTEAKVAVKEEAKVAAKPMAGAPKVAPRREAQVQPKAEPKVAAKAASKAPAAARTVAAKPVASAPAAAPAPASKPVPRLPKRPEQLQHFTAPVAKRAAPAAPTKPAAAAKPAAVRSKPSPTAKAAAHAAPAPAPKGTAAKATAPAAAPAKPAPRQIEGRGPVRQLTDKPDLSAMPGAVVVSGKERLRQGAAAKRS